MSLVQHVHDTRAQVREHGPGRVGMVRVAAMPAVRFGVGRHAHSVFRPLVDNARRSKGKPPSTSRRRNGAALTCTCMCIIVHEMRTTIDLPDEQRAKLLELAAKRGEKGFSTLVQEAVAVYLEQHAMGGDRVKRALLLRGAMRGDEGDKLLEATQEARKTWR